MGKTRTATSRELSLIVQRGFGVRLREARNNAHPKVAQKALAAALDVTRTSISNIENGRHRVFLDQVYAAAATLGIPISELLPDENDVLAGRTISSFGIAPAKRERLIPIVTRALEKASRHEALSGRRIQRK